MNRKASKIITPLLILALLLSPIAILTTCRGSPARNIEDVSPDDWFYRYVVDGLRFGIIVNEGRGRFRLEPDKDITLGEFVTMLGRLHEYGHGTIGTPGDGPDYVRYFEWATEKGIILAHQDWDGLTHYTHINREQKAVLVMLYIVTFELHDFFLIYEFFGMMLPFWDHNEMSPWSRGPAMRLNSMQIMHGKVGMYFIPHDSVSRAEAVQILIRIGSAIYDLVHPIPH